MTKKEKQEPVSSKILLIVIVTGLLTFVSGFFLNRLLAKSEPGNKADTAPTMGCNVSVIRLQNYKFIKPLAFIDYDCESEQFTALKYRINSLIDSYKGTGKLVSASVYLKLFYNNEWMGINENEKYSPGSLMKVPVLITLFKMKKSNPNLFNLSITYSHPFSSNKRQNIQDKHIVPGHTYTVRDLIDYMIIYSDNDATNLLDTMLDTGLFMKVFTDLGLQAPDWKASDYPVSPKDFSLIMRALYNSVCLSPEDSEQATEILSHTQYRNGLLRGLPDNLQIAHKFGEGGFDNCPELSESAIIYLNGKNYLLTVMAKGNDLHKTEELFGQISNAVFQGI
jgi:beta-lactamase class A